jgi:hypothetical protein
MYHGRILTEQLQLTISPALRFNSTAFQLQTRIKKRGNYAKTPINQSLLLLFLLKPSLAGVSDHAEQVLSLYPS